ncbi:MAG TPA: DUF2911 domain-containing protein [Thermoanaerobaculia bacterium]|nr:DUF2911 domain-containing protein [Thermoanaerobaculia bacterium]
MHSTLRPTALVARTAAALGAVVLLVGAPLLAHNASPRASVSQMIGMSKVTVDYGRPGVKERAIWGELVPYGEVWKTGADAMTTLELGGDLEVGGTKLAAGTYGILTIPEEGQWTVVVTKRADIHRPSTYDPAADDALRLTLVPETAPHQERLQFTFDELTMTGADLVLHWETKRVRIPISE